jgi:amphi-Trp domain-containing protein
MWNDYVIRRYAMGREKVLFSSEERSSAQDVASFLRQLADKIEQNEIILKQGSEEVRLAIPNNLVLELKAEEEVKGDRTQRSLEVELAWYEGEDADRSVRLG